MIRDNNIRQKTTRLKIKLNVHLLFVYMGTILDIAYMYTILDISMKASYISLIYRYTGWPCYIIYSSSFKKILIKILFVQQ